MNKDWIEWVGKFPDWAKGTIGFLTLVIGFFVLLQSNLYLGITVSATVTLIASLCISVYVVFSKRESTIIGGERSYRFPRYRVLAQATTILILSLVITLLVYDSSRTFAIIAFLGTPTPMKTVALTGTPSSQVLAPTKTLTVTQTPNAQIITSSRPVTIEQILFSQSETYFRLETTLKNLLPKDVLITHIEIFAAHETRRVLCCCPPSETYVISDTLTLSGEEITPLISGAVKKDSSGFSYAVTGRFDEDNCNLEKLSLGFDTALLVPANQYLSFNILIPKSLRILDYKVKYYDTPRPFPQAFIGTFPIGKTMSDFEYRGLVVRADQQSISRAIGKKPFTYRGW